MKEIEDKKEFIPYYVFNEGIYLEEIKEAIDKTYKSHYAQNKIQSTRYYKIQDTTRYKVLYNTR